METTKNHRVFGNQRKSIYEFINKSNQDKFIVLDEYVDDGYSGTNFNRPDFQRLLEDIETKGISAIITKDLSRLGRDHILTGYYIENFFKDKGIRYIAINDNIDSKEDDSFDMLTFRLAFNDFYPKDTSKKILKIKKLKQEKGEYQGSWAPFGYRKCKTEKNKLEIEPEQAKKRIIEIDNLFMHVYEDNISGKITDERFRNLSFNYDKEQKELKAKLEQLSKEIDHTEKKTTDLTQFISNVKKYTEITELTPEILNELIEKILVHQTEKVNGKKVQEIDIYYRGVGIISFPVSLEDMTMVIEKMLNKRISA